MPQNLADTTFDVAISFCREQRPLARAVARRIRAAGLSLYFDEWNAGETSGRLLHEELASIYFDRSRHCLVLLSDAYLAGRWPQMEWTAIEARLRESGQAFLTVVPIGLTATATPTTAARGPIVRPPGATRIAEAVLEKLGGKNAFRSLKRMQRLCLLIAALLVVAAVGAFVVNPTAWIVHLIFCGLASLFIVASARFFHSPFVIAAIFMLYSGWLALGGVQEDVVLVQLAMGLPSLALAVTTGVSLKRVALNRQRHAPMLRQHPFSFLVSHPLMAVLGAAGEPQVRALCSQLAARGMRFIRLPIPADTTARIDWPDLRVGSLLVANSRALGEALWNNEPRLSAFRKWLQERDCRLVPVTLDGVVIPGVDPSIGYLDTRQIGAYRSILFLAGAFTNRVSEIRNDHLRSVVDVVMAVAVVTALYKTVLLATGDWMWGLNSEDALTWVVWAVLFAAVRASFYRRPWLTYAAIASVIWFLASALVGGLRLGLQAIVDGHGVRGTTGWGIAALSLAVLLFATVQLAFVIRGDWSFRRRYRQALREERPGPPDATRSDVVGLAGVEPRGAGPPASRLGGSESSPSPSGDVKVIHFRGRNDRVVVVPEETVVKRKPVPEPLGWVIGVFAVVSITGMWIARGAGDVFVQKAGFRPGDPGYWSTRLGFFGTELGVVILIVAFAPIAIVAAWMAVASWSAGQDR